VVMRCAARPVARAVEGGAVPPRRQTPAQAEARAEAPGAQVGAAPAPGGVVVAVPVAVDPAGVVAAVGVVAVRPHRRGAVVPAPGDRPPGPDGHTSPAA